MASGPAYNRARPDQMPFLRAGKGGVDALDDPLPPAASAEGMT